MDNAKRLRFLINIENRLNRFQQPNQGDQRTMIMRLIDIERRIQRFRQQNQTQPPTSTSQNALHIDENMKCNRCDITITEGLHSNFECKCQKLAKILIAYRAGILSSSLRRRIRILMVIYNHYQT
ncbi:hypothetical protein DICPUDRAFT_85490 [Dictyostelium purpureum]|uniref:Uncharacterized protein n=1 Tax=Dictyostelium purpureum TaxID=5786 RepID=F1A5W8_DICPU|nr:uncharacterized protein DICPUDRAFT_85490 [Dictyostelium purpureum]EGC28413.1 hypothetical protein DICPUDRAFT_85490 [Dictyostelium purpureum]|eukprot:XP_003295063.1 hypothetical protein DICPUDRAFT_85490 [Dictyostelium purpureum]